MWGWPPIIVTSLLARAHAGMATHMMQHGSSSPGSPSACRVHVQGSGPPNSWGKADASQPDCRPGWEHRLEPPHIYVRREELQGGSHYTRAEQEGSGRAMLVSNGTVGHDGCKVRYAEGGVLTPKGHTLAFGLGACCPQKVDRDGTQRLVRCRPCRRVGLP